MHFVLDLPASNMKQSIRGEGWGSTSKMVFKLYRWDTDYNTTLAGDPIITNTIPYTEGKHYDMLPSGKTVAPGEYMLSLEATDIDINNPQYWSWGKANEEFVKGAWCGKEEMTANFPEFYCVYDTKVNGSGQVACKTSTRPGQNVERSGRRIFRGSQQEMARRLYGRFQFQYHDIRRLLLRDFR